MFKISKKLAASMAELIIILAIVGILSTLYRKTINEDAIIVKSAYQTIIRELNNFTSTLTDFNRIMLGRGSLCNSFARNLNTVGDINCNFSQYPLVPNLTTTSGMRFFGLEQRFTNNIESPNNENSIFIQVDIDGLLGQNRFEEDIFPVEILQSGRIRATGSSGKQRNNIARDAELYAINVSYVPNNVIEQEGFLPIANRVSYAEAQCLSGNIFPYRDAHFPHEIQFCIADNELRDALNLNLAGFNSIAGRAEYIRRYRLEQALNNTICEGIYAAGGIVAGVTPITATGVERCQYCYISAYARDYCATPADIYVNPDAAPLVKKVDSNGDEICPDDIITATDSTGELIMNGLCSAPQWAESAQ